MPMPFARACLPILAFASACAASAATLRRDADRDNPRAEAAAVDRFVHQRGAALVSIVPTAVGETAVGESTTTPIGDRGLVALPAIASDPPALGYLEPSCARDSGCGCDVGASTHYWRDGDRIVIARMIPDVEVHRIVRAGACAEGCGVQPPSPPVTIRSLGPIDPTRVEIVDLHYPYAQIVETCEAPDPRVP